MGRCAAITRSGHPCKGLVRPGNDYCPAHDPARTEARSRAASKAVRSRPDAELTAAKGQLQEIADKTLKGEIEPKVAAVVAQVLNVKLRALEIGRRIREQEELETRIEALEGIA